MASTSGLRTRCDKGDRKENMMAEGNTRKRGRKAINVFISKGEFCQSAGVNASAHVHPWPQLDYLKFPLLKLNFFLIFHLFAVWSISLPNVMKFYSEVLEKHAPFREGRDGQKIIHSQFLFNCACAAFNWVLTGMAKILQKFLDFSHLQTFLCTIPTND